MATMSPSPWKAQRWRIFQSVFPTVVSEPTPHLAPSVEFPIPGLTFSAPQLVPPTPSPGHQPRRSPRRGGQPNAGDASGSHSRPATAFSSQATEPFSSSQTPSPTDDQVAYDRAWHVVTSRIALPASATAEDSFGSLPPQSQADDEFCAALALVVHSSISLSRAARTEDILIWHGQQIRTHFSEHVVPLLSACVHDVGSSGAYGPVAGDGLDWGTLKGKRRSEYDHHMVIVMSSIRTLGAALRLYSYGVETLTRGLRQVGHAALTPEETAADIERVRTRFQRDIHALVGNSVSPGLLSSLRFILVQLIGSSLGVLIVDEHAAENRSPPGFTRPSPPSDQDLKPAADCRRLVQLVQDLHQVGLAGESFQILFAEIMDSMMSQYVAGAYAGVWAPASADLVVSPPCLAPSTRNSRNLLSRPAAASSSPCIVSLRDWVENHFVRLSAQVLGHITSPPPISAAAPPQNPPSASSPVPVPLSDARSYQSLALGRLASLRIAELFDIALAWPACHGALEDLRATVTTAARRSQLTSQFSKALERRLLHSGRSTTDILRTYIAVIRTLHALDNSKVLLGHVEQGLQMYLCQREDAVRIVVTGLLASPEEFQSAKTGSVGDTLKLEGGNKRQSLGGDKMDVDVEEDDRPFTGPVSAESNRDVETLRQQVGVPDGVIYGQPTRPVGEPDNSSARSSSKLVELAMILNDPSGKGGAGSAEDEELDWNDMSWVPDPVDAGANYKRPRSEDVIGTLISALGSGESFIKEFSVIVAERLLRGSEGNDDSSPSRFEQEIRVLDLLKRRFGDPALQSCDVMIRDVQESRRLNANIRRAQQPGPLQVGELGEVLQQPDAGTNNGPQYHARILSRLFWPGLDREHFIIPPPVLAQQQRYEKGYEQIKTHRRLTWLNQLGQAHVELELEDRTVSVDCSTVQATVIYAFQNAAGGQQHEGNGGGACWTAGDLYTKLEMDEDLVTDALAFWAARKVLRLINQGQQVAYIVVEKLADLQAYPSGNSHDGTGTVDVIAAATTTGTERSETGEPLKAQDSSQQQDQQQQQQQEQQQHAPAQGSKKAREQEQREMYWQYIKGMLTNAMAMMPLPQMAMMLRMLVPDGFPWSDDELQEFLGEKMAEGELEVVGGGRYRLMRK